MKKVSHFIDGKIYSDNKSRKGPIFNPAIGEQIAEVELASRTTVEKAIENSSQAFLKWSKTSKLKKLVNDFHCLKNLNYKIEFFKEIKLINKGRYSSIRILKKFLKGEIKLVFKLIIYLLFPNFFTKYILSI